MQLRIKLAIELGCLAGIPVASMAALASDIEVFSGIPQFGNVLPLDDIQYLKADVSKGLDSCIPLDWIFVDLCRDLVRRQFSSIRSDAVIQIAGGRKRSPNLQQVRPFGHRHCTDANLVPV